MYLSAALANDFFGVHFIRIKCHTEGTRRRRRSRKTRCLHNPRRGVVTCMLFVNDFVDPRRQHCHEVTRSHHHQHHICGVLFLSSSWICWPCLAFQPRRQTLALWFHYKAKGAAAAGEWEMGLRRRWRSLADTYQMCNGWRNRFNFCFYVRRSKLDTNHKCQWVDDDDAGTGREVRLEVCALCWEMKNEQFLPWHKLFLSFCVVTLTSHGERERALWKITKHYTEDYLEEEEEVKEDMSRSELE